MVTTSKALIEKVNTALATQLAQLSTRETAGAALSNNGFAVLAPSLEKAVEVVNQIAPEHLELHLENAAAIKKSCHHYGALFVGTGSAEVLGDYGAGPNHTLPTGGTPRHSAGLSVFDFLKRTTWVAAEERGLRAIGPAAVALAGAEGLDAHGRSIALRLGKNTG